MYKLQISKDFAQAIFWHGNRYETTEFLCQRMNQRNYDGSYEISLSEPEAWALEEAWEDDGYGFACGSAYMNIWMNDFIETIV